MARASAVARWPTRQLARKRAWASDSMQKTLHDLAPAGQTRLFRVKLRMSASRGGPPMKIERIDHLNLTVADIDRSIEFYQRVLGMKAEGIGEGRAALYFGQQKIHLDAAGGSVSMSGGKRMPAHICFITETPIA